MWNIKILTLFPELFPGPLSLSVVGQALKNNIWSLEAKNIRDYATNKHKNVDDLAYGGGGGMIARADVLGNAIEDFFLSNDGPIIYLSPRGQLFNQRIALELSQLSNINFLSCRFESIDERIINYYNVRELSVGDYVLSSGDLGLFCVLDACIRLLGGVIERESALSEESFGFSKEYSNLLEYPHYTKPRVWKDLFVPDVLLSGNHLEIKKWRLKQAMLKTKKVRPDLWKKYKSIGVK